MKITNTETCIASKYSLHASSQIISQVDKKKLAWNLIGPTKILLGMDINIHQPIVTTTCCNHGYIFLTPRYNFEVPFSKDRHDTNRRISALTDRLALLEVTASMN